jgi:hypothetical protein
MRAARWRGPRIEMSTFSVRQVVDDGATEVLAGLELVEYLPEVG